MKYLKEIKWDNKNSLNLCTTIRGNGQKGSMQIKENAICHKTGHIAKDCKWNKNKDKENKQKNNQPNNIENKCKKYDEFVDAEICFEDYNTDNNIQLSNSTQLRYEY